MHEKEKGNFQKYKELPIGDGDIQHPKYHLSKKKSLIIKTQQQNQQQINHVIKT